MAKVLIATFFEAKAVPKVAHYRGVDIIVLVMGNDGDEATMKRIKDAREKIAAQFNYLEIQDVWTASADVVETARKMVQAIQKFKGHEIYLDLTEARKLMFLGGLYAASIMKEHIKGAFYWEMNAKTFLQLPQLTVRLSDIKHKILEQIDRNIVNVNSIAKNVGKHRSLVYVKLKELKDEGFLNQEMHLTIAGKVALM